MVVGYRELVESESWWAHSSLVLQVRYGKYHTTALPAGKNRQALLRTLRLNIIRFLTIVLYPSFTLVLLLFSKP